MLTINIDITFDLYGNYSLVIIKIWNVKILRIYVSIIGLYFQINNSKKIKSINLIFDESQEYLFLQMKKSIVDKLYLDAISIYSQIGLTNCALSTCIVSIINLICDRLKCSDKLIKNNCYIESENIVNFTNEIIYFRLKIKVLFTIFDLVFAIILSFYKRGKYVKERKRKFIK